MDHKFVVLINGNLAPTKTQVDGGFKWSPKILSFGRIRKTSCRSIFDTANQNEDGIRQASFESNITFKKKKKKLMENIIKKLVEWG